MSRLGMRSMLESMHLIFRLQLFKVYSEKFTNRWYYSVFTSYDKILSILCTCVDSNVYTGVLYVRTRILKNLRSLPYR